MRVATSPLPVETGSRSGPDKVSHGREANCFDSLRLFAAVCVVIAHSVGHLNASFLWFRPGGRYWFFDGVAMFFVLSGFLVYRSCAKCIEGGRPVWHFYINRFLRVAPALYAYAALTTALLLVVGVLSFSALETVSFCAWFASHYALVPVYYPAMFQSFGVGVLNGSLWTIPVECSFYVLVPLLFYLHRRRSFWVMIVSLAAIALAGSTVLWLGETVNSHSVALKLFKITCVPYLVFFGLGIFWSQMWTCVHKQMVLPFLCLLAYATIRFEIVVPKSMWGPFWQWVWGVPLSYAIIWLGYHGPAFLQQLTRWGDLSYGTYIWHMVFVNLFLYLDVAGSSLFRADGVVLLVLVTTLTVAAASWHLVEKPALSLKPFTSRAPSSREALVRLTEK